MNRHVLIIIMTIISTVIFCKTVMTPIIIQLRCRDLGIMKYDSESDRFIMKDSSVIDEWSLRYLMYGKMWK